MDSSELKPESVQADSAPPLSHGMYFFLLGFEISINNETLDPVLGSSCFALRGKSDKIKEIPIKSLYNTLKKAGRNHDLLSIPALYLIERPYFRINFATQASLDRFLDAVKDHIFDQEFSCLLAETIDEDFTLLNVEAHLDFLHVSKDRTTFELTRVTKKNSWAMFQAEKSRSNESVYKDEYPDVDLILKELRSLLLVADDSQQSSCNWYTLGLVLEVPKVKLDEIRLDRPNESSRLVEMFDSWCKIGAASWLKLCVALHAFGLKEKACSLVLKYVPKGADINFEDFQTHKIVQEHQSELTKLVAKLKEANSLLTEAKEKERTLEIELRVSKEKCKLFKQEKERIYSHLADIQANKEKFESMVQELMNHLQNADTFQATVQSYLQGIDNRIRKLNIEKEAHEKRLEEIQQKYQQTKDQLKEEKEKVRNAEVRNIQLKSQQEDMTTAFEEFIQQTYHPPVTLTETQEEIQVEYHKTIVDSLEAQLGHIVKEVNHLSVILQSYNDSPSSTIISKASGTVSFLLQLVSNATSIANTLARECADNKNITESLRIKCQYLANERDTLSMELGTTQQQLQRTSMSMKQYRSKVEIFEELSTQHGMCARCYRCFCQHKTNCPRCNCPCFEKSRQDPDNRCTHVCQIL